MRRYVKVRQQSMHQPGASAWLQAKTASPDEHDIMSAAIHGCSHGLRGLPGILLALRGLLAGCDLCLPAGCLLACTVVFELLWKLGGAWLAVPTHLLHASWLVAPLQPKQQLIATFNLG